jgi:hypothetical protein
LIGIIITLAYHWVGFQNNFKMRHESLVDCRINKWQQKLYFSLP